MIWVIVALLVLLPIALWAHLRRRMRRAESTASRTYLYLSHGAPDFDKTVEEDSVAFVKRTGRARTTEEIRATMVAGDWFIVEPRDAPERQIESLTRAGRRVLRIDLNAGRIVVVNGGKWPTPYLTPPPRAR